MVLLRHHICKVLNTLFSFTMCYKVSTNCTPNFRSTFDKRLSAYFSQPYNNVVGSIGYRSRIFPSELKNTTVSKDANHYGSDLIDFSSLWGELHWKLRYQRAHTEQHGMWLTPSELFTVSIDL